jgi:hypothetical protein
MPSDLVPLPRVPVQAARVVSWIMVLAASSAVVDIDYVVAVLDIVSVELVLLYEIAELEHFHHHLPRHCKILKMFAAVVMLIVLHEFAVMLLVIFLDLFHSSLPQHEYEIYLLVSVLMQLLLLCLLLIKSKFETGSCNIYRKHEEEIKTKIEKKIKNLIT